MNARLHARRRQAGFSSVMVIAIIVMLASLCAYALRFVSAAQGTQNVDLLAARATQAAQAGLEWQRFQLRSNLCVANTGLVVPFSSTNFAVNVRCTSTGSPTDGTVITSYTIVSTACWPAGPTGCPSTAAPLPDNYVERQVRGIAVYPPAP